MSPETATAATPPETEATPAEPTKPLPATTTDPFTQSTRHCTRRAWDVFLSMKDNLDAFNTKQVRVRIEASDERAAQGFAEILKTDGEVTRLTQMDNKIECTTTLAAIQLIIKDPEFKLLDAIAVD